LPVAGKTPVSVLPCTPANVLHGAGVVQPVAAAGSATGTCSAEQTRADPHVVAGQQLTEPQPVCEHTCSRRENTDLYNVVATRTV